MIHLRRLFFLRNLGKFDAKKKFFQKFTGAQIPTHYYYYYFIIIIIIIIHSFHILKTPAFK